MSLPSNLAAAGWSGDFEAIAPFLTDRAWVDPKVIKPKPFFERPWREYLDWNARDLNSIEEGDAWKVAYGWGDLNPGILVDTANYDVDLDPSTSRSFEARAPVSLNTAAPEILEAVFTGLRGT